MTTRNIRVIGEFARWPKWEAGPFTIWNKLACAFLLAVLGCNVYRAATQSITTDEAFSYEQFISKPCGGLLEPYNANNHVLNSLLGRASIAIFGLKEWSLRLPSLMGGALYLFAAYRLCVLLFGSGAWSFLTAVLLASDPFLLDHLSAARGYGLALGFLMLGLYALMRGSIYLAGISCGLAIASNLTSVFPVAAIAIAFAAVTVLTGSARLSQLWSDLIVPGVLASFPMVVLPLSKARPAAFYFGAKRLGDTMHSLVDLSFAYGRGALPLVKRSVPACLLLLGVVAVCRAVAVLRDLSRNRGAEPNRPNLIFGFLALSFAAVLILIGAVHAVWGTPYPLTRTALYFIPFTILAASSLFYSLRRNRLWRLAGAAMAIVTIAAFLLQANLSYYVEWKFDAGTKRVANFVRSYDSTGRWHTIRASWVLEPALNFYRVLYRLDWEPVDRGSLERPGDVYILTAEDQAAIPLTGLRVIYRDPVSGEIAAVR